MLSSQVAQSKYITFIPRHFLGFVSWVLFSGEFDVRPSQGLRVINLYLPGVMSVEFELFCSMAMVRSLAYFLINFSSCLPHFLAKTLLEQCKGSGIKILVTQEKNCSKRRTINLRLLENFHTRSCLNMECGNVG